MKLPALMFYTGDWLKDAAVRRLCPASRGIWFDLLCFMWESSPRGVITATIDELARMVGASASEIQTFMNEAQRASVCDIVTDCPTDCHANVTLTNRRMVRDERQRQDWGIRKRRQRERECHASVTPNVTPISHLSSSSFSSSKKKDHSLADALFAEFWDLYPRKVGKALAPRTWRKLKADNTLIEKILADVRNRAWSSYTRFIPPPSTYLNDRRWEDEPDQSPPTARQGSLPDVADVLRRKGLFS